MRERGKKGETNFALGKRRGKKKFIAGGWKMRKSCVLLPSRATRRRERLLSYNIFHVYRERLTLNNYCDVRRRALKANSVDFHLDCNKKIDIKVRDNQSCINVFEISNVRITNETLT